MAHFNIIKYENIPTDEYDPSLKIRSSSKFPSFLRSLICIILGLAVGLFAGYSFNLDSTPPSTSCWVSPRLSPIPAEVIERKAQVFQPDERYLGNSEETDRNWKILVDSDAIWIGTPEAYGLGEGMQPPPQSLRPTDNSSVPSNFYDISSLHQVHCLSVVRKRYWVLLLEGYDANDPNNEEMESHVEHCIEYLRLSIACGDFLMVEPDSSGWGVAHECIDFEKLRDFQDAQEMLYIESWPELK